MGRSFLFLIGISFSLLMRIDAQITQAQFDNTVGQLLTAANVNLNTLSTTLLAPIDQATQGLINTINANPALQTAYQTIGGKAKAAKAPPLDFQCDSSQFKSDVKPTSAHQVRIGDINVIALIGDGVGAGLGTINDDLVGAFTLQGRGYCSKGGGAGTVDAGNTTIATIMRDKFLNTGLKGYAIGDGNCNQQDVGCSRLNVAEIYAFHPNLIVQAIELARRIIFDDQYNVDDWKMIHIFYGPNDLCFLCQALHYDDTLMLGLHLRLALKILQALLKNVIVYLHVPYDLTNLGQLATNAACKAVQQALCPCLANPLNKVLGVGATVKSNQLLIRDRLNKIANEDQFNNRDDFTITVIKHLETTQPPTYPNGTYQSEILAADCLHPSRAAHYIHSRYVINEMFTAPADRPLTGDYTVNSNTPISIKCPTATNPYLRTNRN